MRRRRSSSPPAKPRRRRSRYEAFEPSAQTGPVRGPSLVGRNKSNLPGLGCQPSRPSCLIEIEQSRATAIEVMPAPRPLVGDRQSPGFGLSHLLVRRAGHHSDGRLRAARMGPLPALAGPARGRLQPRGGVMLLSLFSIVDFLLQVASWVIIAQAIISWLVAFNVINTHNDFVRQLLYALDRMTAPLYRPIRRILPDFGGLDFSPIVVLLLIYVLRILLSGVAVDVAMAG